VKWPLLSNCAVSEEAANNRGMNALCDCGCRNHDSARTAENGRALTQRFANPICRPLSVDLILSRRCTRRADNRDENKQRNESTHGSNEKEISPGRVSGQTHWACIEMGPLASSIG
jgi:hypothetical protein